MSDRAQETTAGTSPRRSGCWHRPVAGSFAETLSTHRESGLLTPDSWEPTTPEGFENLLAAARVPIQSFHHLLSDYALSRLETMACRARDLTRKHFGNAIVLFTPLYISNYCVNRCPYCSFAGGREIDRRQLEFDEIRDEAQRASGEGCRHVLVLTGEAPRRASVDYIERGVAIASEYFSAVGIEVHPLSEDDYRRVLAAGADSLTVYQETYDEQVYGSLHAGGPKADYRYRLATPERACRAGMRGVTVGALLGLHDFRSEAMATALHVKYLRDTFPDVEVSVSFPRLRPHAGDFEVPAAVSERRLVQLVAAFRIMFPTVGITMSTRESMRIRDGVLPLGVTRVSAGVSTAVGGRAGRASTTQFEIDDSRSVDEMKAALLSAGFQPVMHDWHSRLVRTA